jgi:tetratricopeptide (TPR) repeat protein
MVWFNRGKHWKYTLLASAVAIACWGMPLSLSARGSDLNRQLSIPLNNGTLNEQRQEADRLLQLGQQQQQQGNLNQAVVAWEAALEIYRDLRDVEAQQMVYELLGKTYVDLGRYPEAEDAQRRCFAIARDLRDLQGQMFAANDLGLLLLSQRQQPNQAALLFAQALQIAQSLRHILGTAISLTNLGRAAHTTGDYFQALGFYDSAIAAWHRAKDAQGAAMTETYLGDAYRALKDYRQATTAYQRSLVLAQRNSDRSTELRAITGLGLAYEGLGQPAKAENYLQQQLTLAQTSTNAAEILAALEVMAAYFRRQEDWQQSAQYYQQAIAIVQAIPDPPRQRLLEGQLQDVRNLWAIQLEQQHR